MSVSRPDPPPAGEWGPPEIPRNQLSSWGTIAEVFASHRSPRYAALAKALAGDRRIEEVGPPLLVLARQWRGGPANPPGPGPEDAFAAP